MQVGSERLGEGRALRLGALDGVAPELGAALAVVDQRAQVDEADRAPIAADTAQDLVLYVNEEIGLRDDHIEEDHLDARADAEARRIVQGNGADLLMAQGNGTDIPRSAGAETTAQSSVISQYPSSPSVQSFGPSITGNTIAGPLPARPAEESALNFVPPSKLGGYGSGANNPSLAGISANPQLISKDA